MHKTTSKSLGFTAKPFRTSLLRMMTVFCLLSAFTACVSANTRELLHNPADGNGVRHTAEVELEEQVFSESERKRILAWLGGAMEGLRRVYGEWPQSRVRIRVEQSSTSGNGGSPVPWGQVIRGRGDQADEILLQLNLESDVTLEKDWTVYHELSHTLVPYRSGSRWLSEGLASYYQNIVQARLGLLSEQEMWQKLLAGFERGAAQNTYDRRTLQQVSDGSGQYMRIHWHGALYWLTIDAKLRRESNNERSLDGALKALKRCCEAHSLRPAALVRALDKAYETDLFYRHFERFQRARMLPDFKRLLASIGITVRENKVFLTDAQSNAKRALSRGIYLGDAVHTDSLPDLAALRGETQVGAVAWAAVERGVTLEAGADGYYSNAKRRKVDANSLFRIGSISKTLLTTGVLRMVEDEQLDLDELLMNAAPDAPFTNNWPHRPATLRMLLEHSAGLADLSSKEMNYPQPLSLRRALALEPKNRTTLWPPGLHSSYSNAGAGLLSLAIEHANQQNFDAWFDSHLRRTLHMPSSTVQWSADVESKLIAGYDSDLQQRLPYWHTLFRGFGGVNSTANDMASFLKVFTNQGRVRGLPVLSSHSLQEMQTAKTTLQALAGVRHGRALGVRMSQFRGNWLVSHNGDADGYLSRFAYAPSTQRAYFVLINAYRDDLLSQFVRPLDQWLLRGATAIEAANEVNLSEEDIANVTGRYVEVTQRFPGSARPLRQLRVRAIEGQLFWRYEKGETRQMSPWNALIHVGDHTYRTPRQFAPSIAMTRDSENAIYLQGTFGNFRRLKNEHKMPLEEDLQ